jgi:hypothetical protein
MMAENKKVQRSTVQLSVRIHPWQDFMLRKYAQTYCPNLSTAVEDGIRCLVYGIPEELMKEWLREYHRQQK